MKQETNMNLHNTSYPVTSGPDELVPSRYALKVGDIDVLVVSDGVLPLPTQMLGHNADPADRAAWLKDMFLPQDASDLVLTHMHMDHIGGLLVEGVKERLRKDLRIHVAAAEVKFWESPDFSHTAMPQGFPDALRSAAKRFVSEYGSNLRTFDEEHEIAPGVVARRTGGHTPGHSVVRVASGGDGLTFAGDAVFTVGFEQPDWHNGFEHDPEEAARVRVRLLRELAKSGEMLVATHLPFPSIGRVAADGDAFRFVPVFWDY